MGEALSFVTGIIVPVDWDDKGMPVAAALLTPGGNDYYIEPDETGSQLLEVLTKEVELQGQTKKGPQGRSMISVQKYHLRTGEEPCIIE